MASSSCNTENATCHDDDTLRAKAEGCNRDGEAALNRNESHNALELFTKGININCNDDQLNAKMYANRATAHFYLGNYNESLGDAKAGRQFKPSYVKAIEIGAVACVALSLFEEAINWCNEGLAYDSENTTLLDTRNVCVMARDSCDDDVTENKSATGNVDDKQTSSEKAKKQKEERAREGMMYARRGNNCLVRGDFNGALEFFQQYLAITKEIGDRVGEGRVYGGLGCACLNLGDYQKAIDFYQLRLNIAKEVGDKGSEGKACYNLANAYFSLSNFKKAAEYNQLYLSFAKEVKDRAGEGRAYGNLGNSYLSLGDFQKALDFFKQRLDIAKELKDRAGEERANCSLGNAYFSLGDFKRAKEYYQLNLDYAEEVKDRVGEGRAHGNLGSANYSLGNFREAITSYKLALSIAIEEKDKDGEGRLHGNLGNVYDSLGDVKKAIECHQLRLGIAKEMRDRAGEGRVYGNLGNAYVSLGDFKKAIEYHELCLSIAKEVGDRAREGRAYSNLGNDYISIGDFGRAIDYHQLDLSIAKEVGDKAEEARANGSLGNAYRCSGDFEKAIEYQQLSLGIAKDVGDKVGIERSYGNLGNAYFSLGDFTKAMKYLLQHLESAEELGDKAGVGKAHGNLGSAYLSLGNFDEAKEHYQSRLRITKEIGDRAGEGRVYGNLGNVYDSLGDSDKAIEYHQLCLSIAKEVGDKNGEGSCYCNLGVAYHSRNDFQKAIEYQQQYLSISKESGDTVGEARAYGNLGEAYQSLGDLCKSEHFYTLSVDQYDKTRDLLQTRDQCDKIRDLLQTKDQWKISLRDLYDEVYTGLVTVLLKQGKVTEALLRAEEGRAQALKDLIKLQYGLDLALPRPVVEEEKSDGNLSHITSQTVFIASGPKELNFWVLQKGKDVQFRQKEIGKVNSKKEVIESLQALTKNAYEEIRVNRNVRCENRALDEPIEENLEDKRCEEEEGMALSRKNNPLRRLYETIIEPIDDLIRGCELVIVPDGPLFLAPFAAFLDHCSEYLCESFRIRLIPSLTAMKLITECPENYHSKREALLVGDPLLTKVKRKRLGQLPFAKKEVEMIGNILNVSPLVGEQATKAEVIKRLTAVSLVHIAAHGSMETGEIALSPNPTRSSKVPKKSDYMLTMEDVLSIKVCSRLVVLSCCHSGHGEIKAEGVVGIARAFLGAGARCVLVSLWAINDEATQEFMRWFYQHLVEGKNVSEAINLTRKFLRESESFHDVKHWAPFMLIGDDVTLDLGKKE
ncbi:uncharacterized protein LOC144665516 [Oculina patagonica]